ncbi:MAG: amino acid ABC transporter ATP-binding protein [Schwartzia sp.]|nr:amino acid ABC transporter ATP-binding protein [Schwartzia sp. (in: firmicutes)]
MSGALLRIEHLKKEYPGVTPLKDVNLTVNEGEIIAIIGSSGCGKSTLLRQINQMERATAGKIFLRDEEITAPGYRTDLLRQKIGMIFQSFNLFSHLTVVENIMAAPVNLLGLSRQNAYDRAKELAAKVGLSQKLLSYPDELSGGQQQRIAIVRALAMEPKILLFDEPTSALDPTMVGEVETVIRKVAEMGVTMMIVTHDMEFARKISSRVLYMDEGGVYEDGPPEQIFERPQREKTRQFIQRLKVLTITVELREFDFIGCHTRIEGFGQKNGVPKDVTRSLMLLFEELVTQLLLPRLPELPRILWTVEYEPKSECAEVSVRYNGEHFDVMESDNEISLRIVRGSAENIRYAAEDGEMPNCLSLTVRRHGKLGKLDA